MALKRKILNEGKNLLFEVHLIGYPHEGESIIFFVKSEEKILYTGVIDSYEFNGYNHTIEMLKNKNINKIDFLCWTHMHEDHSLGMDKLLCDYIEIGKTRIILPDYIEDEDKYKNRRFDKDTINRCCDKIDDYTTKYNRCKLKPDIDWASTNKDLAYVDFYSMTGERQETLFMKSIAPNSRVIKSQKKNKKIKQNDYSIAIYMKMGTFSFLFGGDLEDKTIDTFSYDIEIPSKVFYVKIPHHTSEGSKKLLDYLNLDNPYSIACTTVKCGNGKGADLPIMEVLNEYRNSFYEVACTSAVEDSDKNKELYGVYSAQFDILNREYNTDKCGNAIIL